MKRISISPLSAAAMAITMGSAIAPLGAHPAAYGLTEFGRFAIPYSSERMAVFDPYGRSTQIDRQIREAGRATVRVIPHLDNLEWAMAPDGTSRFPWTSEVASEFRTTAERFVQSLPGDGVLNLDALKAELKAFESNPSDPIRKTPKGFNPFIDVVVNERGFLHLGARRDIRSMSGVGSETFPPQRLDKELLDEARKHGGVLVNISLKMPAGFTAHRGYISERSWNSQVASVREAFVDIIRQLDPAALPTLSVPGGIPIAQVTLSYEAVAALVSKPDPRISELRLPKPAYKPAESR